MPFLIDFTTLFYIKLSHPGDKIGIKEVYLVVESMLTVIFMEFVESDEIVACHGVHFVVPRNRIIQIEAALNFL